MKKNNTDYTELLERQNKQRKETYSGYNAILIQTLLVLNKNQGKRK